MQAQATARTGEHGTRCKGRGSVYLRDMVLSSAGVFVQPVQPGTGEEGFGYSDGSGVEDGLLRTIAGASDRTSRSLALKKGIVDWPTKYHLSPSRTNLLRPFGFLRKSARVLELGCGCGAITRYLGETCGCVDAVEGSVKRAQITRERCEDLDNVKVYVANFLNLQFDGRYDVVTLIGVLEYAAMFYPGHADSKEGAFIAALKLAASALKEDGVLVVAIENQIGLKYWAGCREDHTGTMFDGLHGYPRDDAAGPGPVTFTRNALTRMINQAGIGFTQYYFPLPDYKLPHSIIADGQAVREGSMYLHNWAATRFDEPSGTRAYLFAEPLLVRTICSAGLLGEMANSFLVVACKQPLASDDWVAKRYSTERRACFATETTLCGGEVPRMSKRFLYPGERQDRSSGFTVRELEEEWQAGDLLLFRFYEAMMDPKTLVPRLVRELRSLNATLLERKGKGTIDKQGYPLLKPSAFDFGPWNMVVNNGVLVLIDDEWEYDGTLAADYLMYRSAYNSIFWLDGYLTSKGLVKPGPEGLDSTVFAMVRIVYPDYDHARHEANRAFDKATQEYIHGLSDSVVASGAT